MKTIIKNFLVVVIASGVLFSGMAAKANSTSSAEKSSVSDISCVSKILHKDPYKDPYKDPDKYPGTVDTFGTRGTPGTPGTWSVLNSNAVKPCTAQQLEGTQRLLLMIVALHGLTHSDQTMYPPGFLEYITRVTDDVVRSQHNLSVLMGYCKILYGNASKF
jgi:hypothetical protein